MSERTPYHPDNALDVSPGTELLNHVHDTLSPYLIPLRRTELTSTLPRAARVLHEVGFKPEVMEMDTVDSFERGALVMGIVAQWGDEARIGNKQFEIQLAHVMDRQTVTHTLEDDDTTDYGLEDGIVDALIEEFWPESAESPNKILWAKEHKAREGIVTLPFKGKEHQRFYAGILKKCGVREGTFGSQPFSGVAYKTEKVGFVWAHVSPRVVEHERMHILHPGLVIGRVGSGLDEAVTDWKARKEVYGSEENDEGQADPPHNHIYMLDFLYYKEPGLQALLETRYEHKTADSSRALIAGLINRYGLEGYKRLFFVHPQGDTDLANDKVGYESPHGILTRYLYPNEDPGFSPHPLLEIAAEKIIRMLLLSDDEITRRIEAHDWYRLVD
jgi:hypothetical protein